MNGLIKLVLVGCIAYAGYNWYNKSTSNSWPQYQFQIENVKVSFPHSPKVEKLFVEGSDIEFTSARNEFAQYTASYTSGFGIPNTDFYPHMLVKKGAKITDQEDVFVGGHMGMRFELAFQNRIAVQQFIDIDGAIVNQTVIYDKKNKKGAAVDEFFESLIL